MKPVEVIPVDLEAHELPRRTALGFRAQRLLADAGRLLEVHEPPEADLVRRVLLRRDEGFARAHVVDVEEDQARFDARHVEGEHARRRDVVGPAHVHERVIDRLALLPGNPDLVAEVAGVSGARDLHRDAAQARRRDPEVLETRDVGAFDAGLEDGAAGGALKGEGAQPVGDVLDRDLQPMAVHVDPAQVGLGRRPAVDVFLEARHRAVVDHLAPPVAPVRVGDLAGLHLGDVACHHAIDQPRGVAAADAVLEQRRDVDQRGRVADGVVLALVVDLVAGDGEVAGPVAPAHALAEGGRPRVKAGPDRHRRR